MFRLSKYHPLVVLWRALTSLGPLPVLTRPRDAASWQNFWRTESQDVVFRDYAEGIAAAGLVRKAMCRSLEQFGIELGSNVGANLQALWKADNNLKLYGIELNENAESTGA